jgi:hypothetical protein
MVEEDYVKDKIKEFTDEMKKSYEEDNIISRFCKITKSSQTKTEFIQVGERTSLPKEFFQKKEGIFSENRPLAQDFIRSLVNGEKDFILNEIIKSPIINKVSIDDFDYPKLCEIALSIKDATHIFLPIEPFFMKIHHVALEMPKNIKFVQGDGLMLKIGIKEIKIDWITTHEKINKIIVLNKNKIKINQKTFDNAEFPKGLTYKEEYKEFSSGKKVMIYFGKKDEEKFGFVFRTIISKPELSVDSAVVISYPDKL